MNIWKKQMSKIEAEILERIFELKYEDSMEIIYKYVISLDKDQYLNEMSLQIRWEKYMKYRNNTLQSYGYFVYGFQGKQILFQLIRTNEFLTKILFPQTKSFSDNFFKNKYEYEACKWVNEMLPRCKDVLEHIDEYRMIFHFLEDDESKRTLLLLILGMLFMKYEYYGMACVKSKTDYFPRDILKFNEDEVIVDCGGYDGDTAEIYDKLYGLTTLKKYYLYEPDKDNIEKAKRKLEKYDFIKFSDMFVSGNNCKEVLFENNGNAGSKKIEVNDVKGKENVSCIDSVSLDEDIKEKVTYIKMDIEGAELEAIDGATNHIRDDKPKLAICLYHNPNDIRMIIEKINSINSSYNFYIRHYGDKYKETVLFAK